MKHGSLFSGIGGFDLAAEWVGWENMFHCEWNEFGQKVLKYYWPNAISYGDITKTDFSIWRGRIDILTGGFPCQPFSMAGKRKGTKDTRHLWPEYHRAIQEIKPSWVIGENVPGLVNWDRGMVFNQVQIDLEDEGYEVIPFIIPACGVGAPHRRDRIWFVAHANHSGTGIRLRSEQERQKVDEGRSEQSLDEFGKNGDATENTIGNGCLLREPNQEGTEIRQLGDIGTGNTVGIRLSKRIITNSNYRGQGREKTERERGEHKQQGSEVRSKPSSSYQTRNWDNFATQPPVCNGDDGFSSRLDGITFPKWRNESIKAGGNAIVPQVAYQIFKAINEYESLWI